MTQNKLFLLAILIFAFAFASCAVRAQDKVELKGGSDIGAGGGIVFKVPDNLCRHPYRGFRG